MLNPNNRPKNTTCAFTKETQSSQTQQINRSTAHEQIGQ